MHTFTVQTGYIFKVKCFCAEQCRAVSSNWLTAIRPGHCIIVVPLFFLSFSILWVTLSSLLHQINAQGLFSRTHSKWNMRHVKKQGATEKKKPQQIQRQYLAWHLESRCFSHMLLLLLLGEQFNACAPVALWQLIRRKHILFCGCWAPSGFSDCSYLRRCNNGQALCPVWRLLFW